MSTGSTTGHETEFINVQGLKASLKKGGNKGIFNEATCSTAAGTAAKEIATAPKSFSLVAGAKILVTFANAISIANATLQVGSATAKPIYYHGAALAANLVKAGSVLLLAYDGTSFNIVGDLDTDTTYTDMVASGTNHKGGLVPDPGDTEGTTKYLREDGTWVKPPNTTYSNRAAAEGGTQTSLVTTGEKYTWNNKQDALSFEDVYEEVMSTTGKNPAQEGWYEVVSNAYVLTQDTTPASGKTYYEKKDYKELTW